MGTTKDKLEKKAKIIELYNQGYNRYEIQDEVKVHMNYIYSTLRENGLEMDDKIPASQDYQLEFAIKWNKARNRIKKYL